MWCARRSAVGGRWWKPRLASPPRRKAWKRKLCPRATACSPRGSSRRLPSGQGQTGQSVRIRYDTFPYQKYGVFKGTVTQVSHTALTPADNLRTPVPLKDTSYRITIVLDRSDVTVNGKSVPLQPDMLLRADILLEKH